MTMIADVKFNLKQTIVLVFAYKMLKNLVYRYRYRILLIAEKSCLSYSKIFYLPWISFTKKSKKSRQWQTIRVVFWVRNGLDGFLLLLLYLDNFQIS